MTKRQEDEARKWLEENYSKYLEDPSFDDVQEAKDYLVEDCIGKFNLYRDSKANSRLCEIVDIIHLNVAKSE